MADYLGPSDFFEGAIFARGLSMDEAPSSAGDAEDQIKWISPDDGITRELIQGYFNSLVGESVLGLAVLPTREIALLTLEAISLAGLGATLSCRANDGLGLAAIECNANGPSATILDNAGDSDFVQNRPESLRMIRGVFDGAAAIVEGDGFTVSHPGAGNFVVDYDIAFAGPPAVVATALPSLVVTNAQLGGTRTASQTSILTYNMNTSPPSPSNIGAHFVAVGPV